MLDRKQGSNLSSKPVQVLRGWGNRRYIEVLVGQVLIEELWTLAIYGKI